MFAEIITRVDAIEYFKKRSKIIQSNIIETKFYRDQINPDYSIDKNYTVISLTGKETVRQDLKYIKSFPKLK